MKLLLTGGTGYLGGRLARRLREAGHAVRLLVRAPERARALAEEGFELSPGDLASGRGFAEAVAGCEAVVHTAAQVKNWSPHPEEFERTNVGGSWALAEAAQAAGVRRFLYTSSFFALGPSLDGRPVDESALSAPPPARFYNAYHSTKYRAARLLPAFRERGLDVVMLFPSVIFGPGTETEGNHVARILRMVQRKQFPGLVGGGGQRWNLGFVDDIVDGHRLALEGAPAGASYILGGEDCVLRELLSMAAAQLRVPTPKRVLGYRLCHLIAGLEEFKARLTGQAPQLTHGEVDIYRHDWIYTSARAERELGYRITPLATALEKTITWLRETGEEG